MRRYPEEPEGRRGMDGKRGGAGGTWGELLRVEARCGSLEMMLPS
jgi:hypothetical protein